MEVNQEEDNQQQDTQQKLEKVKAYLRVDYEDDDAFIEQLIEVALIYIDSMVGEAYKTNPKMIKLSEVVQLLLIKDMYDNRALQVEGQKMNHVAQGILDKLSNYTVTSTERG